MAKPALVKPDTGTESQDSSWPDHFSKAKMEIHPLHNLPESNELAARMECITRGARSAASVS